MKKFIASNPNFNFLYSLIFFQFSLLTIFRIIFLFYFRNEIGEGTENFIRKSLILGAKFDLRLVMLLSIPAIISLLIPLSDRIKKIFNNFFYTILTSLVTSIYVLDMSYFSYLKSRVNSTVFQFLKNPLISLQMVNESYPILLFVLIILVVTLISFFIIKKFITPLIETSKEKTEKKYSITSYTLFIIFFAFSLHGNFSQYPLRWSQAFASTDPFASNLALNPILYIVDTYSFRSQDFNEDEVRKTYPLVTDFLGLEDKNESNLDFTRRFKGNYHTNAPNIVIIVMESMGYYKTGLGGSKVNPTPMLDTLAKESLLFTNFYTPTEATARSIFATVTSLPDTSKGGRKITGSRNPLIVNQHTIISDLVDHEKYYFLGGSANWGNIRGLLSFNIPNLKIFEEGSYKSSSQDVWGISDLNLFKEAIFNINNRDKSKPFFALIQTSGFHRPYTIPSDKDDFIIKTHIDVSEKELKEYGFDSLAEYNSMRFQDFSLGKFIEIAKKESWYENTIFFIFGDHSLPANNAINVPKWAMQLSNCYHVPLVIHSKKHITPGIETKIASEMDVMPTVAGLVGVPYKTRSFGRDLFNKKFDSYRAAFSYNYYAPYYLSLIDSDYYFEFCPYNNEGRLICHSNTENPNEDVKDKFREKYLEMKTLTTGLYESAKYLINNNPKIDS